MPKFPTYERNVGISGGSTASYASDSAFTAPARAIANAGDALAGVGGEFAQVEAKFREDQRNAKLSLDTSQAQIDLEQQNREAQQAATGRANNYAKDADVRFEDYRRKMIEANPDPEYQRRFNIWADDYRAKYVNRAATFQAESEVSARTNDLATAMSNFEQLVYSDPSQYDSTKAQAMAALDAAKSWLTPEAETNLRAKAEHDLNLARAKGKVDADPQGFLAETGVKRGGGDSPLARLIDRHEGGGRYDTLFGHAQRQNGAMAGVDISQMTIGALKQFASSDGAYGREQKAKLGYLATPMGRFQIVGSTLASAAKEMGLSDDTVFTPAVQNAMFNHLVDKRISGPRTMQGKIAGLRSEWEGFKNVPDDQLAQAITAYEGGDRGALVGSNADVSGNSAYAGLSVDEIRSLSTQAETAVNAQNATAYASLKDSMEQGIATGSILSEAQIINSGLNGGDVATLLGKYRTAQNDGMSVAATLEAIAGQSWSGDPFAAKDRKSIDGAAAAVKAKATPEQYQAFTEETVRQSGIVPQDVVNELRRGLQSRNAQDVAAAAQRASRISSIDPAALGRRDGGGGVQDDATAFDHYVNNVGLSQEEAAKRLMDKNDPEKVRARASLMESKPIKDFIKNNATESTVRNIFDPGWSGFDPSLGETPAQAAAMVGEYSSILSESIFDANGDTDLAETLAAQRFQKRYGVSSMTLSGPGVVTRLPPEVAYPPGPDGTHDYVMAQAKQALAAEGVSADEVFLQADTMTENDVKAGKPARYQVFYKQNGQLERYMLPFYAIPGETPPTDLSGSEGRMMENRDQLLKGRDRERSLDVFLDGNPLTGEPN